MLETYRRFILWLAAMIYYGLSASGAWAQTVSFIAREDFKVSGRGPASMVVGDFNRDGFQDLVTANAFSNDLSILLGRGDGTFETARTIASVNSPRSLVTGDFNGDAILDLAMLA